MTSAPDTDPPPSPDLPNHRALTLNLDADGKLRRVIRTTELDAPVSLKPGDPLSAIARAITFGPVDEARWSATFDRLRADPTLAISFGVAAPPPDTAPRTMARSVTATPVAGEDGALESVVLRIEIAHPLEGAPDPEEQHFRFLAETLPVMLWMAGPEGSMEYMSPNWEVFTGIPVQRLKSEGYHSIIHPDDLGALGALAAEETESGDYTMAPFRIRRRDGEYRWVEVSLRSIRDEDGELLRIVGCTTDVSGRRQIELDRRALHEQLRAAVSVSGMGRYEVDLHASTATGDLRTCEILGIAPGGEGATLPTSEVFDRVHAEDADRVQEALSAVLAGGPELDVECRILRPTADAPEVRWLAVRGRLERSEEESVRLYGILYDITDRRAEDAARLRSQKREAIGTLAGGIAHDFNNVISAIWSNASVAQTELRAGASPATSIEEIRRGAERAAAVVRRLLSFSREEEPERTPFDLGAVAREACELVRPTFAAGVELQAPTPKRQQPPILGSSGQLHQVVVNLLSNAGHAAADGGGHVWVDVDLIEIVAKPVTDQGTGPAAGLPPGPYLRLRVRDDGPGIPPEVMPRIFDPFFTTKAAGEGTGLGLAAALAIVRGHGGDITAENQATRPGAEFNVVLPVSTSEVAPPAPGAGEADRGSSSASAGSAPRVMFVDDSDAIARLAERALPLHGCLATSFTSATDALTALRADPSGFDAAIVDLSMPVMTGLQFLEAAREIRTDLPVILSSGYVTDANREEAERLGVSAMLPKPCSIEELAATVLRLTAGQPEPGARSA